MMKKRIKFAPRSANRGDTVTICKPCRYCGGQCKASEGDICGYCREKLPVVRRLIAVGRLIRKSAEEEKKLREKTIHNKKEQEQHGYQKV